MDTDTTTDVATTRKGRRRARATDAEIRETLARVQSALDRGLSLRGALMDSQLSPPTYYAWRRLVGGTLRAPPPPALDPPRSAPVVISLGPALVTCSSVAQAAELLRALSADGART